MVVFNCLITQERKFYATVKEVMLATTVPEYLDAALEFTDTHTLAERMRNRKCISGEFVGKRLGWFEMMVSR